MQLAIVSSAWYSYHEHMPIIRSVAWADAESIAEVYRPIVEHTTISFELTAPSESEILERIRKVTPSYPWLVAIDGEALVGYAYASRHRERGAYDFSVDVSVYLHESARGRGIGISLYSALFSELKERKFHRAFAGIALPNEASVAFHKKLGFQPVGVYYKVGRKFDRWLDVAWWQRALQ